MEGLAPPLALIVELRRVLESGESLRSGLLSSAHEQKNAFGRDILEFLRLWEQGMDWKTVVLRQKSPYRRMLLEVTEAGLRGQSIHPRLLELQKEITHACDMELQRILEVLPFWSLIPMMLLQVPALLILILLPLLKTVLTGVQ